MIRFLASGFYSGYLPKAPGTWGTLVGLPICWLLLLYGLDALYWSTLICFFVGWFCSHVLTLDPLSDPDPSYIVIDEIAGIMLTLALSLSVLGISPTEIRVWNFQTILFWGAVFCSFRLFDIWKPFPINWIDDRLAQTRCWRGFGVMIDDILAAIPAAIIVVGVWYLR